MLLNKLVMCSGMNFEWHVFNTNFPLHLITHSIRSCLVFPSIKWATTAQSVMNIVLTVDDNSIGLHLLDDMVGQRLAGVVQSTRHN